MRRAVAGLPVRPGYVLSDGFRVPGLPMPSLPVVGGDAAAACIAAASVLAKVSRDRLMVAMENEHPGYGFAEHKGYSTPRTRRGAGRSGARAASTGTRSSTCDAWSRRWRGHQGHGGGVRVACGITCGEVGVKGRWTPTYMKDS